MGTFVGFGFGPIQAGLFLTEAFRSGNFGRLVVAEVIPEVVAAVQQAGRFTVNIGHTDRIEAVTVAPVEIYNPAVPDGRDALIAAVSEATEMATALPSVDFYARGDESSIAHLLALGLQRKVDAHGPPAVIYAAENHTRAAALLETAVLEKVPTHRRDSVRRCAQFIDTIIGKMSGVPDETNDLTPLAPGLGRAFLVEAFNRILISQVRRTGTGAAGDPIWGDFQRGITVFEEKPDLHPFAEAKLYGHNAGHALAAYLAHQVGFTQMDDLRKRPDIVTYVRHAMIEESGMPLCQRFAGVDMLFTPEGFRRYAEDLIVRMTNPYVRDTVARVGRDPERKLGWDDRLVGAMRLAIEAGVEPRRYALGVAAALAWLNVSPEITEAFLIGLWQPSAPAPEAAHAIIVRVKDARIQLRYWSEQGYPDLKAWENSI
ncbi:MAG: hypothetical protein H3C34_11595 [Caldilineaceae bacterium]|nr:hypothetical protein [Caldilineaceae bacterium]